MPDLVAEPEEQQKEQEERRLGAMSMLQHVEELRKRIIYSLIAVAVCAGAALWWVRNIYALIEKPVLLVLAKYKIDPHLVYSSPVEPVNLYMKVGLMAGLFIASPVVLYQIWMFVAPGLYRHEKRFLLPFLFLSVGLFLGGGYFGYRFVFPVALDVLIGWYGTDFKAMITIPAYTSFFLTIILGIAVTFELPIVLGFAGMMGVVNAKFLFKHIRGAVLVCVTLAAILSPTTDIMNLTIYAAPMVILYIGSIGLVWLVHPRQRRKRADKRKEKDREDGRSL